MIWDIASICKLVGNQLLNVYLLRFLDQISEQCAVHLLPPLVAVAEHRLELLDADPHIAVVVHHLNTCITNTIWSRTVSYHILKSGKSSICKPNRQLSYIEVWQIINLQTQKH